MQNLDSRVSNPPLISKPSMTKFKVKVFDEDYSHFDTSNENDREFLSMLKDAGTLFQEYSLTCKRYADVLNIRKWIHIMCQAPL
jgi:hypothetical protein